MITKTVKLIIPNVGCMSLVGIGGEYPLSFGNYFWFSGGPYCVNMWAENLEECVRRNEITDLEITVFSDGDAELAFVTDKRVSEEWLNDTPCITGHGWGSRELCEACCEVFGVSTETCLCGCEAPEQSPKISMSGSLNDKQWTYRCQHCKRNWTC